jgi:hypothetical protein
MLLNVFEDQYEGGDFCAGLTAGFEGRSLVMMLLGKIID